MLDTTLDLDVVEKNYLEMNGIIHPYTHGNLDTVVILDKTEMFKHIFSYVDWLYKLVRPCNVLYLAVNSIFPRAKMNQLHSWWFCSTKDANVALANYVAKHSKINDDSGLQ